MSSLLSLCIFCLLFVLAEQFNASTCGVEKGCVMQPSDCDDPTSNCVKAFSYQVDGDYLVMELNAKVESDSSYVAVGFSDDKAMGNDTVTECSMSPEHPLKGRLSYNLKNENQRVNVSEDSLNDQLETVSADYKDGRISCVLRQRVAPSTNFSGRQVRSLANNYYILLATGPTSPDGNGILMHPILDSDTMPFVSANIQNLQQYRARRQVTAQYQPQQQQQQQQTTPFAVGAQNPSFNVVSGQGGTTNAWNLGNLNAEPVALDTPVLQQATRDVETENKLKKAHGILMCIGWMIFISTGMMYARYFRDHWPNTKICGLMLWFHLHRTVNMIGIACTIASFVCIFVAKDWRWVGPTSYNSTEQNQRWNSIHAILGLLACVVAWAQPLNAVFRCHPENSFRPLFNMIHRFFGFGAWLMAAAATMIAVRWFGARFTNKDAALGLYIAFVAVFGVVLILSELLYISRWWKRRSTIASTDMEMTPVDRKVHVILSPEFEKMNRIQYLLFIFFVVVAVGTCVALCCLMGLVDD